MLQEEALGIVQEPAVFLSDHEDRQKETSSLFLQRLKDEEVRPKESTALQ